MSRWKRSIDVVGAGVLFAALAPTMAVLAVGLRRSTGRTAIFRQRRAGRHGRPFVLYKFRTMTEERATDGSLLPDVRRLTRLGKAVRSLSLDELPQLWNVLRGDMSLVGPRPLPVEYIALYDERERTRLSVPPGITGWAQINGRQGIPFSQRLELDAWYVEHWSLRLDLEILALTIPRMLRRTGVALGTDAPEMDDRGFLDFWKGRRPGEVD